jgi:hypothetical protein
VAAVSLLSGDSRAYFVDIYRETLAADERRLNQLDPVRRLLVLSLRSVGAIKEVDLRQLTPDELTALAFEARIIGQDLDASHELDVPEMVAGRASAKLRSGEHVFERREWFQLDEDGWRYDILPILAVWDESLQQQARELGVEDGLVVDMTVEAFFQRPIDSQMYAPREPLAMSSETDSGEKK